MAAPTITTGVLTGGSNSHQTASYEANALATDFVSNGVVGTVTNTSGVAPATGAFAVNAQGTPDKTVAIYTGVAYVTATPSSQTSQALRINCTVSGNLTIADNSSGSTKYDWIYISISSTNAANPNTAADNVATIVASRSSNASTDDGTPPTYGYCIAVVTVANGFTTITNGNISDRRAQARISSTSSSNTGWTTGVLPAPNSVTYNGNRSYTLTFNSTDLTSTVSNKMRLRTTRLVTAPTQCTNLNGTTQFYSKSSPAAMTFTDDFVVSAWIKVSSYPASQAAIVSRYSGTSGWQLLLQTDGTIYLGGFNAGSSNVSRVSTSQSIPLNKWVHIAAQLDMSSFTATTTTSYIMFDGVDIPCTVGRGGTNPTALVQAGNLEIGSANGGGSLFTGKIAQAAVFSAKVTEATIRGYISQGLSGTETSLISAYSFNNSINDLNANANNLSASGSAVATTVDSPFTQDDSGAPGGTVDCSIIMSKSFSTNTTLNVQVPEGCTIPTSGGISAVAYSTQAEPYGFPADPSRWTIYLFSANDRSTSSASFASLTDSSTVPIGAWNIRTKLPFELLSPSATTTTRAYVTLSSNASTETNPELTSFLIVKSNSTTLIVDGGSIVGDSDVNLSTATAFTLIGKTNTGTIQVFGSTDFPIAIRAVCRYL